MYKQNTIAKHVLKNEKVSEALFMAQQLEDYACSLPQTSAARSKTLAASNT